jgi:hypothetical protein
MKVLLAAIACFVTLSSRYALATDWTLIGETGNYSVFLDWASIKREAFPKGEYAKVARPQSYTIIWTRWIERNTGAVALTLELALDCQGRIASIQQLVNGSNNPEGWKTFDQTTRFNTIGVQLSDIPPDTVYEGAQNMACKKKGGK